MLNVPALNVVRLAGAGRPLIMLHGWGQTLSSLYPLGELLAATSSVHLVDLPGFGKSMAPPADWGTAEYACQIIQYMDSRKLPEADLLGHSFGGRVSLRLAGGYPQRVRRLVLINSAGLPPPRTAASLRITLIRALGLIIRLIFPDARSQLRQWHRERFGSADYRNAGPLRGTLVKTVNEDLTAEAARVRAPTLLIWGALDTATPPALGVRFKQLIPNSTLITLPGKDHFPFRGAGAHLCAHHIRPFLAADRDQSVND